MKILSRIVTSSVLFSFLPFSAFAQDGTCHAEQSQLNELGQRYSKIYEGYQKEGEDLKKDSVTFNFDVKWADSNIIFDTPTVTVKDQKLIFGTPQTTLIQQEIVFGTPSVRMVQVKTGQYPEFTCDHAFIPSCTVTWSNTYASVPEPFMQEQKIVMGIPEFKWEDTAIVMGIPEFSMQQQKWVVGLPQFTLKSVVLNQQQYKDRSDSLGHRIGDTVQQQKNEAVSDTHQLYSCYRNSVQASRQETLTKFNQGLATINGVIQAMSAQGADPTKVPGSNGTATDLVAQASEVTKQRDAALAQFDNALAKLDTSEQSATKAMAI